MQYAIIETGGKQYKVQPGDILKVERLEVAPESTIVFDKILLFVDDGTVTLGAPYLESFTVSGKVLAEEKGEKVRVSRFLAKSRYRKTTGFRHTYTKVLIESLGNGKKTSEPKVEKAKPAKTRRIAKTAQC